MAADARMIGVGVDGDRAVTIMLEKGWIACMEKQGFPLRTVDVGQCTLTKVAVLSAVEAARINKTFGDDAAEEMRRFEADPKRVELLRHMRLAAVQTASRVSSLLDEIGTLQYFSAWVLVETADID